MKYAGSEGYRYLGDLLVCNLSADLVHASVVLTDLDTGQWIHKDPDIPVRSFPSDWQRSN